MNLSQKLSGFAKTFRSALLTRWRGFLRLWRTLTMKTSLRNDCLFVVYSVKFTFSTEGCLWFYWTIVIFCPLKVEINWSTVSTEHKQGNAWPKIFSLNTFSVWDEEGTMYQFETLHSAKTLLFVKIQFSAAMHFTETGILENWIDLVSQNFTAKNNI